LDKFIKESINSEIVKINNLIIFIKPLVDLSKFIEPEQKEIIIIAMAIHSFYTGIEKIGLLYFESIKNIPRDNQWHKALLNKMFSENHNNIGLIRQGLRENIENYLAFRHLVRNLYCTDLKWDKMKILVENLEDTWEMIKSDFEHFFKGEYQ